MWESPEDISDEEALEDLRRSREVLERSRAWIIAYGAKLPPIPVSEALEHAERYVRGEPDPWGELILKARKHRMFHERRFGLR